MVLCIAVDIEEYPNRATNMNKTPVSILQEMMVKKGTVPNYDLIHDGGGSHMNTFTYQVTCDGLCATGTGRCKKDAKHEAAKAMIEKIAAHSLNTYPQLPASPAQSPVRTPLPPTLPTSPRLPANVPFVNAIGALQDLCAENNLDEPMYIPVSDVGPPHARVFTYHCVVSTFKEEGIATTKKQARQEAAKNMLNRLIELIGDSKETGEVDSDAAEHKQKQILANKTAVSLYPQLTKLTKTVNLGIKLVDYHIKLKSQLNEAERDEILSKLTVFVIETKESTTRSDVDATSIKFKDILSTIKLDMHMEPLKSASDCADLVVLRINSCPSIVQIGKGGTKAEAELDVLCKAAETVLLLLK